MTTQTAYPTPVGPFGLEAPAGTTEALEPAGAEIGLDALPLLDHRLRVQTVAPELALRGPHLVLHDGEETRLLRLDQDITHIGRGSGAEIRFDDHRVSREHAILVRHGRYVRLLDNRSANGTYVNGRQIVATNLSSGDLIELGPLRLGFLEVL
ncbi:MAG TPA: FHA domain-containing protein [Solirubrobacteraceae bacterium]|nr:FHA domain-containing protein [Solirubrobacteraceae bacterium]